MIVIVIKNAQQFCMTTKLIYTVLFHKTPFNLIQYAQAIS